MLWRVCSLTLAVFSSLLAWRLVNLSLVSLAAVAVVPPLCYVLTYHCIATSRNTRQVLLLLQGLALAMCGVGVLLLDPAFQAEATAIAGTAPHAGTGLHAPSRIRNNVQPVRRPSAGESHAERIQRLMQQQQSIHIGSMDTPFASQGRQRTAESPSASAGGGEAATSSEPMSWFRENRLSELLGQDAPLPLTNHPELANRTQAQVHASLQRAFDDLPSPSGRGDGGRFSAHFKNPCWFDQQHDTGGENAPPTLQCLPYAYLLGMPKSGTTDLYSRIAKHPQVRAPRRKEIRWFTRGEFTPQPPLAEGFGLGAGVGAEGAGDAGGARESGGRRLLAAAAEGEDAGVDEVGIPRHQHQHKHNRQYKERRSAPKRPREGQKRDEGASTAGGDADMSPAAHAAAAGPGSGILDSVPLDATTPLRTFTQAFDVLAEELAAADAELRDTVRARRRAGEEGAAEGARGGVSAAEVALRGKLSGLITIDGGPHTLWWPLQTPSGTYKSGKASHRQALLGPGPGPDAGGGGGADSLEVSIPQQLRELQPDARFLVTLAEPGRRMYSDYHFLGDDLKPVKTAGGRDRGRQQGRAGAGVKSPEEFHRRVVLQVQEMRACIAGYSTQNASAVDAFAPLEDAQGQSENQQLGWFRAAQICAHDRFRFARGGWGRLSIGMYVAFLEKWLEHFPAERFMVLRMEDYDSAPRAYLAAVFDFLGLDSDGEGEGGGGVLARALGEEDWENILGGTEQAQHSHKNAHRGSRPDMLPETRRLLDEFYAPYNRLLARLLDDDAFLWQTGATEEANGGAGAGVARTASEPGSIFSAPQMAQLGDLVRSYTGTVRNQSLSLSLPSGGAVGEVSDYIQRQIRSAGHVQSGIVGALSAMAANASSSLYSSNRTSKTPSTPVEGAGGASLRGQHQGLGGHPAPDSPSLPQSTEPKHGQFAKTLCQAALLMDVPQLRRLLALPDLTAADFVDVRDQKRTALHCIAAAFLLADASPKSALFGLLKGVETPHSQYFVPQLPVHMSSVSSLHDVMTSLQGKVLEVATELLDGTAKLGHLSLRQSDMQGNTPLHFAVIGGMDVLVRWMLDRGADPCIANADGRLPLHLAAVYGHARIAAMLLKEGEEAHLDQEDANGVTPRQVLQAAGGPVTEGEFKVHLAPLELTQPLRRATRRSMAYPSGKYANTAAGRQQRQRDEEGAEVGGWSTARLAGHDRSTDSCAVDQVAAADLTAADLYTRYVAAGVPVLIKGLLDDWPARTEYTRDRLQQQYGSLPVTASSIPYSDKFGGGPVEDLTLGEYVQQVHEHRVAGGVHPLYVFRGHRMAKDMIDKEDSLAKRSIAPTPKVLQETFKPTVRLPAARSLKRKRPDRAGDAEHRHEHSHGLSGHGTSEDAMEQGGGGEGIEDHASEEDPPPSQRRTTERNVDDFDMFVNAQWALGCEGTGAPVHFHNTAWNALVYGAKKWFLYPPRHRVMSNLHIRRYVEGGGDGGGSSSSSDMLNVSQRSGGFMPLTCVQTSGDVMIVPESWGHGVLNLQDSVALATELRHSQFRIHPAMAMLSAVPTDNRRGKLRPKSDAGSGAEEQGREAPPARSARFRGSTRSRGGGATARGAD